MVFQASGVSVQPSCIQAFNDIKLGHKYRYIIYSLTDDLREIRVLKAAAPYSTYDDFVDDLKEAEQKKECRYGLYDAEYELKDGQRRNKLVFFLWSPECAKIKQKMVYTSSKDALKRALVGIGRDMQACDHGDLAWTNVLEALMRSEVAH
ncbi:Cofilin [Lamellibrachia satsuma]|nr:Cofilin [Lamellibrachia satsuma]